MASTKITGAHDGLISVQEFAERYHVEQDLVRLWLKEGRVRGKLVGPRMLRLDPSIFLTPIIPKLAGIGLNVDNSDPVKDQRAELVGYLVAFAGMDVELARTVVEGMSPDEAGAEHAQYSEAKIDQPF